MQESNVLKTIKSSESQGSPLSSPDLILRAQPTVLGILKTLTNKNMVMYSIFSPCSNILFKYPTSLTLY